MDGHDLSRCEPLARRSIRGVADITHSYRIRAYPNGAQRRLLDC
jgi:hypothetical protein